MIEIPVLNRQMLANPLRDSTAAEYCQMIRWLFFPGGICGAVPGFKRSLPIGFLLFTNRHPEMLAFMSCPESWPLFGCLAADNLHIFSSQPQAGRTSLAEREQTAMTTLLRTFGLGKNPVQPQLVLCDLEMTHKAGRALCERIYDARIPEYFAFEIEDLHSHQYPGAFRNSLGSVVAAAKDSNDESPARRLAKAIAASESRHALRPSGEGPFREDLTAEFVAAWMALTWRHHRIT